MKNTMRFKVVLPGTRNAVRNMIIMDIYLEAHLDRSTFYIKLFSFMLLQLHESEIEEIDYIDQFSGIEHIFKW